MLLPALLAAAGLALPLPPVTAPPTLACDVGAVQLRLDFAGAGGTNCQRVPGGFRIDIVPEATPINPSPWYAFDLQALPGTTVTVALHYDTARHRYVPKFDRGFGDWQTLDEAQVALSDDRRIATLSLTLEGKTMRVAGQPVIAAADRQRWLDEYVRNGGFHPTFPGQSVQGVSLPRLTSLPANGQGAHEVVVILGNQHPPEVPGWLAQQAFMERLARDDEMTRAFRARFRLEMFPLLNPDGIDAGHWRLNAGLTDLNRDWGPFNQPETAMVRDALAMLLADNHRLVLMLDWHSTNRDVLYTLPSDMAVTPADFIDNWVARMDAAMAGNAFPVQPGHNPDNPTSKTWFSETFAIPAVTVEIGDETPLTRAVALGTVAAEAMMAELLATPPLHSQDVP